MTARAGFQIAAATAAIVLGVLVVVCAAAAIHQQTPFSEYLEQARRCAELNDCPSRGGLTQLGPVPLYHGASWIRLLVYSLRAKADLTRVQAVVLGLWILSIPIAFALLHRYLGLRAAALGLGLYFPVVLVGTDIGSLTYTNLTPLPFAMYYLATALFVEFRSTLFAAIASVALAGAISAELGSIVMVVFHIALVALLALRPLRAVAICALSLAIPFCLDSMDAALEIVRQAATLPFIAGVAISAGAVGLVGAAGGKRLLQMPATARVRTVMIAALVYPTAAVWLACVILRYSLPSPRYLAPAGLPFVYLAADRTSGLTRRPAIALFALEAAALVMLLLAPRGLNLLQVPATAVVTLFAFGTLIVWLFRRRGGALWPFIGICASAIAISVAVLVVRSYRGAEQAFTLGEAEQVVSKLYSAGFTYPELLASLQGPAADDLMALLTARDPNIFTEPAPYLADPDFSLLAAKVPDAAIPRTPEVVAAIPVGANRSAIVVRGERPYLDWLHMRRCGWTHAGDRPSVYGCVVPATDRALPHNWPYVPFGDPTPLQRPDDDSKITYEVPVKTSGHGRAHVVRTPSEWPATWRITRVSGVDFTGDLPATEIRLLDGREASGVIEFEFASPVRGDLPWVWRPHSVEIDAADDALLGALGAAR